MNEDQLFYEQECELCKEKVPYCTCIRCFECATLHTSDETNCRDCGEELLEL